MNLAKPGSDNRKIWDHIWYPTEEDILGFKVFRMITIPLSMLFLIIINIFSKSGIWSLLMFIWLVSAITLRIIATTRCNKLNKVKQ